MAAEQVDPRLDHRHSDLEFLKDQGKGYLWYSERETDLFVLVISYT
jgi:hypothetical protein